MRKICKKGIGQRVAHQLWNTFSGVWQVRVWDNNTIAHTFWDATIKNYVKEEIIPYKIIYQGHDGLLVYKFKSRR
jgi:predicted acetyltransferase